MTFNCHNRRHASRMLLPVLICAIVSTVALAERTRFWRQSSFDEFEKGTAKGVALRSDGKLVLAPRFAQFSDPNLAYLWALRVDSRGTLYAAGGTNAKVVRFDAEGKTAVVFEAPEMTAQALAVDRQDNLYVGTSPDGKVYRVTPKGEKSVFFEPGSKYIWDLAFGSDGTLYVATGDKGEVFAVAPDGQGRTYYKSQETHARALAFDSQGRLLVGTEPSGLILRLEKPAAGKPQVEQAFVLYETARKEVTALATDAAGNLYVAAVGLKSRAPSIIPPIPQVPAPTPTPTPTGQQPPSTTQQTLQQQLQQQQLTGFLPFPTTLGGSEVYRLAPDGAPEVLWSSRDELVYALGLGPGGKLLLGTGNKGLVIRLEGGKVFSNLAKTASAQVTALTSAPGGRVFVATANPGKVFALGPGEEPEGSFESDVFDAKVFSHWGRLTWWGENGTTNGQARFYVRSGNTSEPEKNWSPWAGPYANAQGEAVSAPPARFVQWKVVFSVGKSPTAKPGETPNIAWVSVAYLPKNVAPEIEAIAVQNPGVRVQTFGGGPQQPGGPQPVQLRLPQSSTSGPLGAALAQAQQQAASRRPEPPPQGFAQKGMQAVLWSAADDNDDDLLFSVYFRGEGEQNWKVLAEKLDQKFYSWDTTTMPDGAYYLKIVASDAPSNPPEEALAAERVSDRFEVDNTPPEIVGLAAQSQSPNVRLRFVARDGASTIARVEYSVNAGEWKLVFPTDRLTDAREESYEVALRALAPGEHTVAVRAFDRFENSTSAKVTFTVPPPVRR